MELRRRNSTSSQTLPSWFGFTERTVAWAVWFGPQVPFRRAVESSYLCGAGLPAYFGPKCEAGSRPDVRPIKAVGLAIQPSAAFRNRILCAGKVGGVRPVRSRGSGGRPQAQAPRCHGPDAYDE